jgi:segregation and condensation protein A
MALVAAAGSAGEVVVSFAADRRPEEATQVRLESFDGPLSLLLSLIEQRQLDVLTVSLGDLAGAYLEAVAGVDARRLPMISSFVATSAQLILIKSRAMLPRPPAPAAAAAADEPDPEEELRRRLIEYRLFRDAGQRLAARLADGAASFHREPRVAGAAAKAGAVAPPGEPLEVELLVSALAGLVRIVPPVPPPPETLRRIVTIEERADVIRATLRAAPAVVLQDLLGDLSDRLVVAVTFMAMLELVRRRELTIEQPVPWGPIEIRQRSAPIASPVDG